MSFDRRSSISPHPHPGQPGTIHFVAGTWAAGKTTLSRLLPALLPGYVIFDWDLIFPGISLACQTDIRTAPTMWPGLHATWAAILRTVAACGCDVVLLGPVTPDDFDGTDLGDAALRCAYLNWPDQTIADRLRIRGVTPDEIADELWTAEALRSSPHFRIDLAGCTIEEMAERVSKWVRAAEEM